MMPFASIHSKIKLGDKERFDKEQIGVKEPFRVNQGLGVYIKMCKGAFTYDARCFWGIF